MDRVKDTLTAYQKVFSDPDFVKMTDMKELIVIDQADIYSPVAFIDQRTEHDIKNKLYHVWALGLMPGEGYHYVCPVCCNIHCVSEDVIDDVINPGCVLSGDHLTRYYTESGKILKLPVEKIVLHRESKKGGTYDE